MGMDIDEARRDDQPARVDDLAGAAAGIAQRSDLPRLDSNVALETAG